MLACKIVPDQLRVYLCSNPQHIDGPPVESQLCIQLTNPRRKLMVCSDALVFYTNICQQLQSFIIEGSQ